MKEKTELGEWFNESNVRYLRATIELVVLHAFTLGKVKEKEGLQYFSLVKTCNIFHHLNKKYGVKYKPFLFIPLTLYVITEKRGEDLINLSSFFLDNNLFNKFEYLLGERACEYKGLLVHSSMKSVNSEVSEFDSEELKDIYSVLTKLFDLEEEDRFYNDNFTGPREFDISPEFIKDEALAEIIEEVAYHEVQQRIMPWQINDFKLKYVRAIAERVKHNLQKLDEKQKDLSINHIAAKVCDQFNYLFEKHGVAENQNFFIWITINLLTLKNGANLELVFRKILSQDSFYQQELSDRVLDFEDYLADNIRGKLDFKKTQDIEKLYDSLFAFYKCDLFQTKHIVPCI